MEKDLNFISSRIIDNFQLYQTVVFRLVISCFYKSKDGTYILIESNMGNNAPSNVVVIGDALKPIGVLLFVYVVLVGVWVEASLLRYHFK